MNVVHANNKSIILLYLLGIEKKQNDEVNRRCKRGNASTENPATCKSRELAQCDTIKHEGMNITHANTMSSILLCV